MAAVLASGEGAVVSHITAAMLWKLIEARDAYPHITTPTAGRGRPGILRHTSALPRDETTIRDGIATTSVTRTILDLASILDRHGLERALAQAEFHRYAITPSFGALERHRGNRGMATLREVLAGRRYALGITESDLEADFLRFLDHHGLERPELQVPMDLDGYRLRADGLWREAGLVAELDGRQAHMTETRFESDRLRDRKLGVHGLRTVRVTGAQLVDPRAADELARDLTALGVRRTALGARRDTVST